MTVNLLASNNLVLFFAFVIPGFISMKTYGLFFPHQFSDVKHQLFNAVAYSCIYYALFIIPILWFESSSFRESTPVTSLFYIMILLVVPVVWVFLWIKFRVSKVSQNFFPYPIAKPWDYIFKQQDPFWVIIELKDGTKVGGLYSENSFSSNAPAEEQIYLEETWKLNENGGFDKKKQSTKGIIVSASEMKHIEFFELNFE